MLIDAGYVEALKAGEVELVAAVVGFDGPDVLLAGGDRIQPEVVIVATGYRTALEPIVGHLGVLDEREYPQVPCGSDSPKVPGLFFNGYWATMSGQFRHMRRDARKIARTIARAASRPVELKSARIPRAPFNPTVRGGGPQFPPVLVLVPVLVPVPVLVFLVFVPVAVSLVLVLLGPVPWVVPVAVPT